MGSFSVIVVVALSTFFLVNVAARPSGRSSSSSSGRSSSSSSSSRGRTSPSSSSSRSRPSRGYSGPHSRRSSSSSSPSRGYNRGRPSSSSSRSRGYSGPHSRRSSSPSNRTPYRGYSGPHSRRSSSSSSPSRGYSGPHSRRSSASNPSNRTPYRGYSGPHSRRFSSSSSPSRGYPRRPSSTRGSGINMNPNYDLYDKNVGKNNNVFGSNINPNGRNGVLTSGMMAGTTMGPLGIQGGQYGVYAGQTAGCSRGGCRYGGYFNGEANLARARARGDGWSVDGRIGAEFRSGYNLQAGPNGVDARVSAGGRAGAMFNGNAGQYNLNAFAGVEAYGQGGITANPVTGEYKAGVKGGIGAVARVEASRNFDLGWIEGNLRGSVQTGAGLSGEASAGCDKGGVCGVTLGGGGAFGPGAGAGMSVGLNTQQMRADMERVGQEAKQGMTDFQFSNVDPNVQGGYWNGA